MPVTKEDIRKTATLARLRLTESELDSMTETLAKVFQYIDTLNEVDTTGVEPLHHVLDMSNVTEPDIPLPCLSREDALRGAPDQSNGFFRLPRVIN